MGGSFDRAPTEDEMAKMKALVARGMKDGAVGFSTGLIYLPGTFAKTEEIIDLAKVAAEYDGVYASHMRNEREGILDALAELIRIAREARIRADVSHIKQPTSGNAEAVLAAIEKARAEGLDITHDQYVYTASSTGIATLIPADVREGGDEKFRERIADPEQKARIVAQMKERLQRAGRESYDYVMIASYRADRSLNGKSIVEAARLKRGSDSLDDQIELILEIQRSGGASGIFHGIGEEHLQRFLAHPNTMVASDGGVRAIDDSVPHPRSYGNNARVLARYVRELKLLRLEDAIRKMTSLPATTFRLKDRGLLREGAWADLVLFDPATIQDHATFTQPHQYATGIPHVFVNGVAVIQGGRHTDARPGKALKRDMRR
jgi:N-acyl-D-amino-acid deacylase